MQQQPGPKEEQQKGSGEVVNGPAASPKAASPKQPSGSPKQPTASPKMHLMQPVVQKPPVQQQQQQPMVLPIQQLQQYQLVGKTHPSLPVPTAGTQPPSGPPPKTPMHSEQQQQQQSGTPTPKTAKAAPKQAQKLGFFTPYAAQTTATVMPKVPPTTQTVREEGGTEGGAGGRGEQTQPDRQIEQWTCVLCLRLLVWLCSREGPCRWVAAPVASIPSRVLSSRALSSRALKSSIALRS